MSDAIRSNPARLPRWVRTILALIAAPIFTSVVGASILAVVSGYAAATDPVATLVFIGTIAMSAGVAYALPVALSFGWLIHILLMRIRLIDRSIYICASASLAIATFRVAFAEVFEHSSVAETMPVIVILGIAGGVGGLIFWILRRPDRDALSAPRIP